MTLIDLKPVRRCGECYHLIPAVLKNCPYCHGDVKAKPLSAKTPNDEEAESFHISPLSPETKQRLLWGGAACALLVVAVLVWQFVANSMVLGKSILEPLDESTVISKTKDNPDFERFYNEVSELRNFIKSEEDKEKYKDVSYNDFLSYYNSYSSVVYCDEIKKNAAESYDKDLLAPMHSRIDSVKVSWTKFIEEHDVNNFINVDIKKGVNYSGYPIFYFIVRYPKEKLSDCSATLHFPDRWGYESTYNLDLQQLLDHNSADMAYNLNWEDTNYWKNNEITLQINSVRLEKSGKIITADDKEQVPEVVTAYLNDNSEYNELTLIRELLDSEFPSRDDYALKAVQDNLKKKNTKLYELIERVEMAAGHPIVQRGF